MNIALHEKLFPHWSEVLSALTYATEQTDGNLVEFCHYKKIGEELWYVDPLGKQHRPYTQGEFAKDTPLIVNGSIHRETSPLSYNKIPYNHFKYKLAIEHTTGYSPWDFLQMVDLALISRDDPENAGHCRLLFQMHSKFYDRFMGVDWKAHNKPIYENYKSVIAEAVEQNYVKTETMELAQFWLESVPRTITEESDRICIVLNWANFRKAAYVMKIVELCKQLHEYTGLDIDIKLHSFCKESFLKYFTALEYVHIIPYVGASKYDIMDKYKYYFVDGTGFGYETAHRSKFLGRDVNIFYVEGLPAEDNEFEGIVQMNAIPEVSHTQFLGGTDRGNFSAEILDETFPHKCKTEDIPKECYDIIHRNCEFLKNL